MADDQEEKAMRLAERLEWVGEKVEGRDVLDVGCVGQIFTRTDIPHLHDMVRSKARSVLGIDIDRDGVERMRTLGYDVICADAERYDATPRKFGAVTLCECIEHTDNPGLTLDCCNKNLQDDGILVLTTVNGRFFGIALKEMLTDYHTHFYTPKLLSQMLGRHGFKVVEVQFFEGRKEYPLNLTGKLYEHVFLHFYPQFAPHFGVVAEKITQGGK